MHGVVSHSRRWSFQIRNYVQKKSEDAHNCLDNKHESTKLEEPNFNTNQKWNQQKTDGEGTTYNRQPFDSPEETIDRVVRKTKDEVSKKPSQCRSTQ